MLVNVLGPFEVMREGVLTTPSAPKLRRVLGLLAVNANNVVRADQFIEELWEDRPPVSATTTLQTYIYQLRKLYRLGNEGPARSVPGDQRTLPTLHTTQNGYALTLGPGSLDSERFVRLAEKGRAELANGEIEAAVGTLRHALGIWRGPALTDVGVGPVLGASAVWLEELRRSVLEQRMEADLLLGRDHQLVGELTAIVAQEPIHEGFQSKLMLALYRCGRRSEALQLYQRARAALADELGVEPSPSLQRLHRAILAADPSLDSPQPERPAVRIRSLPDPPSQLPPDGPGLVGRGPQLTAARQVLTAADRSSPPVVVAVGAPGVGTSAFCVNLAHRIRGDYPDGQLYASLIGSDGTPVDPADVLADFLRTAGVPASHLPASVSERIRAFRSWTADRRVLVVLDDVASRDQLLPLLPTGPGCATVAASRRRLSDPSISATVGLRPLVPADGLRLLTEALGQGRVMREPAAAAELVEMCDGLPLALRAVAGQLELRPHWSIGRQVSRMRRSQHRPAEGTGADSGLLASVRRTCRLMPESAQAAFWAVAQADQPVTIQVAAATLGVAELVAESLLEDLVLVQLVETLEPDDCAESDSFRYLVRPILRDVARTLESAREPLLGLAQAG
jgi:DNA-binding SARP family transcriptional activator